VPAAQFLDTQSGRNNALTPVTYRPVGVIVPDGAAVAASRGDETADESGAQARRVRVSLAAILDTGVAWPVPRAGFLISDGQQTYNVEAVTVYYQRDAAILYEVRAAA
jgi:hypothetical protein